MKQFALGFGAQLASLNLRFDLMSAEAELRLQQHLHAPATQLTCAKECKTHDEIELIYNESHNPAEA